VEIKKYFGRRLQLHSASTRRTIIARMQSMLSRLSRCHFRVPILACLLLCWIPRATAQSQVVDVTVHSAGLEHNLLGDPADQPVSIVLPAAYAQDPQRRFPVLYFLHGYTDTTPLHQRAVLFAGAMDRLFSAGKAPFIAVLPMGLNRFGGAFYANSSTEGNWDDYITRDVVGYVDSHYRTVANAKDRVVAGHSMGGYGALTLAFRHPGVFSYVYAMSPCCTDIVGDFGPSNFAWRGVGELKSPDEIPAALKNHQFFVAAFAAMDAALAPDTSSAIFGDPPFKLVNGQIHTDPAVFSEIAARLPANMIFPLLTNIVQLKGIFIEYGAQENFSHIVIGAQEMSQRLSQAGVAHTLEVFQGDHGDHIDERATEHLLPWAAQQFANSHP
jgi:S-formylglutathione hydrolase